MKVVAVESRCDAVALGSNISVPASFVWRCLTGSTMAPFPHPAHRTGHADLPHPALGQDLTPSSTARRAQACSSVRAQSARTAATRWPGKETVADKIPGRAAGDRGAT